MRQSVRNGRLLKLDRSLAQRDRLNSLGLDCGAGEQTLDGARSLRAPT